MHLRHEWREVARVFNPPAAGAEVSAKGDPVVAADVVAKALHGFTQVEYVCQREGCSKRKIVEHIGRIPDRGTE